MPKKADPTLTVLREIRDELREHRRILGEHRDLLADHGQKLGALERRHVESEVRLATELVAVASAVQQVRDLLPD